MWSLPAPCEHRPLAPLSTSAHTGHWKGAAATSSALLLPARLKAAEQVKFIVIQAEMAAAVWHRPHSNHAVLAERLLPQLASPHGLGCVAARGARMISPAAWPRWPCWQRAHWPLSLLLREAEEELSSLFSFWLCRHRGVANFPHWTSQYVHRWSL